MKKPTNRAITTMSSKSNRLSLMCRASTLALAAAGLFASGSANAVPCFIPGPPPPNNVNINAPEDCVLIDANGHNNVNVNADVGGALGTTFYVNTATVGGRLTNNQTIFSADSVAFGMSDATIIGGITNNGIIQSTNDIALQLAYGSFVSQIVNDGTISGGVYGIDAIASSWAEGLINTEDGVIHGGSTAIRLTNNAFPGGGITNSGTIEGGVVGIRYDAVDSEDDAGITNDSRGLIQGGMDAGSSESTRVAIWIEGSSAEYHGDLTNHGVIEAYSGGFVFQAEELFGDIINTGSILAETGFGGVHVGGVIPTDTFVFHQTELFVGNFENTGLIDGGDSTGVFFGVDVLFSGKGQNDTLTQLVNRGRIEGGEAGFSVNAFVTGADFINDRRGVISSSDGTGVSLSSTIWFGNVLNQGLIEGDRVGMAIAADPIFGGKFNPFSVSSFNVGAESTGPAFNSFFVGTVENSGTISGVETGLLVDVGTFYGSIENSGTIIAIENLGSITSTQDFEITETSYGSIGLYVGGDFDQFFNGKIHTVEGDIANSGLIQGGTGVVINLDDFRAGAVGFENSGSINGTTGVGVFIDVARWEGTIRNTGSIFGADTGVFINAGTIIGDFINEGHIEGGASDTGLHIAAFSYSGNITNALLIDAPGDALHLEFDDFTGNISNSGTIVATSSSGVAVLLGANYGPIGTYTGGFTNTGIITGGLFDGTGIKVEGVTLSEGIINNGGTITAEEAIDTRDAAGSTTILNTGGGIINGDLRLSEDHTDEFIGEDGGVYGEIRGSADGGEGGGGETDDFVVVRNGTQFFVGSGRDLDSYTVEDGGVALFGTDTFGAGGEGGAGFTTDNVRQLTVETGGQAYISDNAQFDVDGFTQEADSELTFFLTPDEGHGQIASVGTVDLNGTISAAINVADFTSTSQTEFSYLDVITASGLTSSRYSSTSVNGGSFFFDLDVIYDGGLNPTSVDLLLTRRSLDSLSCSTSTTNNSAIGQMLEQAFQNGDLTPDQLALYNAILSSTDGCQAASLYDDLSGTPFDFIAFQLDGPFKKMVGARIDGGRSTGCIVAGSSGCFNRYAADTTAASAIMSDGTPGEDPFGWLKSGVRKQGSSAIWGRAVGVWGETDGDAGVGAPGSDFNQKGAIIGGDHVFSDQFLAGVAAQYTDTDMSFSGHPDEVHVNSYELGAYMSLGDTQGYINTNVSYIWHAFDTSRLIAGSPTHGSFDGATISAYLELGKIYESDDWRLQPIVALSLASLSTDGYTETGASLSRLVVKDSGFDSLKSILGGRFAYPMAMQSGRRLVPEVRVSWSHELMDNSSSFDARLFSFAENPASYFTTNGAEYSRDSLILGTGLNAPIDDRTILYFDYDATLSSDQQAQTLSGGFRILW